MFCNIIVNIAKQLIQINSINSTHQIVTFAVEENSG